MPCAFVRNCVIPATTICIINLFMSRVGFKQAHLSRVAFILSVMGDQGCASSSLLPIQAPRTLVAVPSMAILMLGGRVSYP